MEVVGAWFNPANTQIGLPRLVHHQGGTIRYTSVVQSLVGVLERLQRTLVKIILAYLDPKGRLAEFLTLDEIEAVVVVFFCGDMIIHELGSMYLVEKK